MAPPFAQKATKAQEQQIKASQARTSKEDIARDLDTARGRKEFFSNRPDVSDDRALRRMKQADELQQFKNLYTKPVIGSSNLLQMKDSALRFDTDSSSPTFGQYVKTTVADKATELALKYGPTFEEIGSDVGYAIGSMTKGAGDLIMSGNLGIIGAIKGVYNYATDKAKNAYNSLTDVQKEIADNPNKYTFTQQQEKVKQLKNFRDLASEAGKDVLGLAAITAADATDTSAIGGGGLSSFVNEPIDTLSGGTMGPKVDLRSAKDYIDKSESFNLPVFREPVVPAEEVKKAAMDRFSPEYLAEQQRQLEELNKLRQVEALKPNAPGGTLEDMSIEAQPGEGNFMFPESYTIPFTDIEVPSLMRKIEGGITGGKGLLTGDDQASVTEFNNPGNLTDVGQAGTTGQTYGDGFAVFPNAQAGITALENDLALKVNRSNKVEDIIGQYAAGDPNVGNYIDFVKNRVGPTVDQNELDDLRNAVIRFENKPDIAERYLALVADGGLMDKKMYGGIIASKG